MQGRASGSMLHVVVTMPLPCAPAISLLSHHDLRREVILVEELWVWRRCPACYQVISGYCTGPATGLLAKCSYSLQLVAASRDSRLTGAIKALLDRPNWFRCWVVQEITLARRGRILCGNQSVCLDAFHSTLTAIYFPKVSRFARQQPHWNAFGAGLSNNSFHIRGLLARQQHLRGLRVTLVELLLAGLFMASDARDIIFALLGIAADTNLLGLRPDYNMPVEQIYTAETPRLPSWVPDWHRIGRLGIENHPLSYRDYFNSSRGRTQPSMEETDELTLPRLFAFGKSEEHEQDSHHHWLSLSMALTLWRTVVGGWMGNEKCTSEFDALARRVFHEERIEPAYILRNVYSFVLERKHGEDLKLFLDEFCDQDTGKDSLCDYWRYIWLRRRGYNTIWHTVYILGSCIPGRVYGGFYIV
ncbi:heterokaryon incompatibility protein [Hirsutella rhossiliensis]